MSELDTRDTDRTDYLTEAPPKDFAHPRYALWEGILSELITNRRSIEAGWEQLYEDYRGHQEILGSDEEIIVNVTFGHTRVMESVLYFEDPYIRIRPRSDPQLAPRAELLEKLVNAIWYAERFGRTIRRCIVDACLTGLAWGMVGYSDYHGPESFNRGGKAFLKRVGPIDLYTEDDLSDISEATFFARRGLYSTRLLHKMLGKTWKADAPTTVFKRRGLTRQKSSQATLFEVHDLLEGKILTLSPQHKEIVLKYDYPYEYFRGSMYVPLYFVDDPERLYPISMTQIVRGQQDELNRIRTQQMRHRKRFNRRYLLAENTMKDEEIEKLEQGDDGTVCRTRGDPRRVLAPVEDAPLDFGSTRDYQLDIKGDMREILGINEYMRAGLIPRTKTAQEASMIQQGASIRSQNLALYVRDFVVDIARRLVLVIQNEYDDINYLSTPEGGITQWTKEDIAGDYEVEVGIGSMLPPAPMPFEQQLGQTGGTSNPVGMPPGTEVAPGMGAPGPEMIS